MTTNRYLTYVGGGILVIGILIGIVFGCKAFIHEVTKERPHFNSGKVVNRDFRPSHYDDWMENRWIGEVCYGSGTNRNCTQQYMQVWHHDYVPDRWEIQIQNCNVNHKDGTQWVDKTGAAKCFEKWLGVDQNDYNVYTIGKDYGVENQ